MKPLIPKALGDCGRRLGAAAAHLRRPIRRGRDNDGTTHSFLAQNVFDKSANLAPAFSNQADHDDIGIDPSGQIAQQGRFPDPRTREKPDPLPLHEWKKGVEKNKAGADPRPHRPARVRRWGRHVNPPLNHTGEKWPLVKRPPVGINHAAAPIQIRREANRRQKDGRITNRNAGERPLGKGEAAAAIETDDFGPDKASGRQNSQPIANPAIRRQA